MSNENEVPFNTYDDNINVDISSKNSFLKIILAVLEVS